MYEDIFLQKKHVILTVQLQMKSLFSSSDKYNNVQDNYIV